MEQDRGNRSAEPDGGREDNNYFKPQNGDSKLRGADFLEALEKDPMERLRWRVLRSFGIFPASRQARRLGNRQLLLCAAHMLIDMRSSASQKEGFCVNSGFDEESFRKRLGEQG